MHVAAPRGKYLALLSLTALGIVYGDIGTSPLYAVREAFLPEHGLAVSPSNILGVLSLILWSLLLVISVKYLGFILRADHRGEGGILALAALATPMSPREGHGRHLLVVLGLIGTALLYGDGAITPAISVLSAIEGLQVATPLFAPYVLPITIAILIGLFGVQHHGTGGVGRVFGPVVFLWFIVLSGLGISQIIQAPEVLAALDPRHAFGFFIENGWKGFVVLGSVFLVVTGGEALYADLGHLGRRPIMVAWFALVLPALLLNYFGQGALLLRTPEAISNPFYLMAPRWALYPLVALSTAATVIASQALISGAFSLTLQAVGLGVLPRLSITHTSAREAGQIYIPAVNWGLMLACIALVLGFGTSSDLAAAYGVAVTTTMVITTILFFVVTRERWGWKLLPALALCGAFMVIDLAFWGANLLKIPHGGWFPLVLGASLLTLMLVWRRGRARLTARVRRGALAPEAFVNSLASGSVPRVPGTAVFMIGEHGITPPALLHNLKHNRVLHERVIFLTVESESVPEVSTEERVAVRAIGGGIHEMTLRFGYMESPDVPAVLGDLAIDGTTLSRAEVTYFLARETVVRQAAPGGMGWARPLFALMNRNARSASSFFHLPPNRVVELGAQVEL
jgi:KUP system potassium uptake protein